MIIYLDESGDLGFDFSLKHTSHYLIMTCLVCKTLQSVQSVNRAIKLTIKQKLALHNKEVKGSNTSLSVKKYFYSQLEEILDWEIVAITVDKKAWLRHNGKIAEKIDKNIFYDQVAWQLLSQIQFFPSDDRIQLIVDKSKTRHALKQFDQHVITLMRSTVSDKTPISIYHRHSHTDPGLQATDLFSWGIYRKYQQQDEIWYDIFKHHISVEVALNLQGRQFY